MSSFHFTEQENRLLLGPGYTLLKENFQLLAATGVVMGLHFWDAFVFLGLEYNINYVAYVAFIGIGLNFFLGVNLIYQARNQMDSW